MKVAELLRKNISGLYTYIYMFRGTTTFQQDKWTNIAYF